MLARGDCEGKVEWTKRLGDDYLVQTYEIERLERVTGRMRVRISKYG